MRLVLPSTSGINIVRSLKAFRNVLYDDHRLRRLGIRAGWYVRWHYQGRLNDRLGRAHRFERIELRLGSREIRLSIAEPYTGALKGIFVEHEYDCARQLGFVPETILDLGANIGFGAIYLSTLFPMARFLLVEPDPRNIAHLRENVCANGIHATILEAAVGPESGHLTLRYGHDPTCSTLDGTKMHNNPNGVTVSVMTIPDVLHHVGWTNIDLMKMDIEGAEEMLLANRSQWLERVRSIVMEIHPNTTLEQIAKHLKPYGFVIRRLSFGNEPVYLASRAPE